MAARWWDLSVGHQGPDRDLPLLRSGYWYELAKGSLPAGLLRLKVEQRLSEIGKTVALAAEPQKTNKRLWEGLILLMPFEADTVQQKDGKLLVRDLSGKGNDGEVSGAALSDQGRAGAALMLDGNGGMVIPGLRNHLAGGLKSLSISLWVKEIAPQDRAYLFEVGGSADHGVALVRDGADRSFRFVLPLENGGDVCRAPGIVANDWRHVVAVWDGTEQRLYVDGQLAERAPTRGLTLDGGSLGNAQTTIGRRAADGSRLCFHGLIDELAVYARALPETDIYALYQMGLQGKCLRK